MVAGDFEQFSSQAPKGDDVGVEGVDKAGNPSPGGACHLLGGSDLFVLDDMCRPGDGEDVADIADLVGGLRLVEGPGKGGTVEGGVPAPSCTTGALLGWVSEGHMPELASCPGRAKDKPAGFDDGTADAGVHVKVQDRTGARRGPATRFGYGGKAGVIAGQKGPAVSLARPEHAQVDVVPAEVRRLGEVVVDHSPGNSNGGYPDAATVAPADGPQCLPQLAQDLVGVPSVRSLGPDQLGPAELRHGELPGLVADGGGDHEGPSWMGMQGRGGPAAPTGRRSRALSDQVEGAETGHGLGDETARHAYLTSYGCTLDARSFVDGPENCNGPGGPP
jgi:hypothetical protein